MSNGTFPTYDYSLEVECESNDTEQFAVFNGNKWECHSPCANNPNLTYDFVSRYCFCKNDKSLIFDGTSCVVKNSTQIPNIDSSPSDILDHFYQTQLSKFASIKANPNNTANNEIKQSIANLIVLEGISQPTGDFAVFSNKSDTNFPTIIYKDNKDLSDEDFIEDEMSFDVTDPLLTSIFKLYIAK